MFDLVSSYSLAGDQINAVKKLVKGIKDEKRNQTLMGVTGSGKTFTMANVIKELKMPALIMAPNKILSAQLYEEFKEFFPENSVEYFVSYYDYYRPEAYIPQKGLYLEKESSINETIDQLRHKATRSLIERKDTIIVASVSCIYGIGSYEAYSQAAFHLSVGEKISVADLTRKLISLTYEVSLDLARGKVKIQGQTIWLGPSHIFDKVWRIKIEKNQIIQIVEVDPINRKIHLQLNQILIFPNTHHITPENSLSHALKEIEKELKEYIPQLKARGKIAEAQRLEEKVRYDIAQLKNINMCSGIENYSRFFTNRDSGQHPPTLFEYFPKPFLLFVDESHISLPQVRGMSRGDAARKDVLIDYGFRMPSCRDNRPMTFEEWDAIRPSTIFVSATPGEYEKQNSEIIEQVIRPTGLLDPICEVRPTKDQIDNVIEEINKTIKNNNKVLMLTLTKKTAENFSQYLKEKKFKVEYLHGELTSMERIEKLYRFKKGEIDIIVGVNLLREGIDVPECALVCIFDADQEGFLRTESALIQMIGRAARNVDGKVILYADKETKSMKLALDETKRRREVQNEHNKKNNITPKTIIKKISSAFESFFEKNSIDVIKFKNLKEKERKNLVKKLEKQIKDLVKQMKFEEAASLRDERNALLQIEML